MFSTPTTISVKVAHRTNSILLIHNALAIHRHDGGLQGHQRSAGAGQQRGDAHRPEDAG